MRAIPASMPRRISSRARSRCRTRARSSRRCCPAAKPGEQVIDLCAGAGGKTLALAAMMQGKGRLIATDRDKRQLAPIHERLSRAGVHNAEIRTPKGDDDPLADIHGIGRSRADRRALHRHRHLAAQSRRQMADAARRARGALKDQAEVLDRAAPLGEAGRPDRLHHLLGTCRRKTASRSAAFVGRHPDFAVVPPAQTAVVLWDKAEDLPRPCCNRRKAC